MLLWSFLVHHGLSLLSLPVVGQSMAGCSLECSSSCWPFFLQSPILMDLFPVGETMMPTLILQQPLAPQPPKAVSSFGPTFRLRPAYQPTFSLMTPSKQEDCPTSASAAKASLQLAHFFLGMMVSLQGLLVLQQISVWQLFIPVLQGPLMIPHLFTSGVRCVLCL